MTSLFYLALTNGTTTLELTDGINFSISDESGWLPNVAFDSEQRTVVDSIPINILGAARSGGRSQAGKTRVNYIKLLTMLRQIERGQQGDGSVVTLIYTSPNSAPARRIACQVTRWDPSTFPADVSSVINLPQHEINEVVLTLEHRVPWVWQSYLYENLITASLWDTTPTPTGLRGTFSWAASAGYYGGAGYVQGIKTNTSNMLLRTTGAGSLIAATNGVPVTVTFTAALTADVTGLSFLLNNGASTASSVETLTPIVGTTLADGIRYTATVTPTATANLSPAWSVDGPISAVAQFAEVFAHATESETWHPDTALEGVSTTTAAAHPVDAVVTIIASPSLADTMLTVSGFPLGATYPTALGPIFTAIAPAASVVINYPDGGAVSAPVWTSVADVGANSLGGTVLRFTPTAANTYYSSPAPSGLMIDAMPVGTLYTSVRKLQIVIICRNNSATSTVSAYIEGYAVPNNPILSRTVDIPPNGSDPIHVIMPPVYSGEGFYDFRIQMAGSVAGQTLDIDRVICLGLHEETFVGLTRTNYNISTLGTVIFDPQTLIAPQPVISTTIAYLSAGAPQRSPLSTPDLPLIRTKSGSIRVIVDAISDNKWQPVGAAVATLQATLTRPPAFDAPL